MANRFIKLLSISLGEPRFAFAVDLPATPVGKYRQASSHQCSYEITRPFTLTANLPAGCNALVKAALNRLPGQKVVTRQPVFQALHQIENPARVRRIIAELTGGVSRDGASGPRKFLDQLRRGRITRPSVIPASGSGVPPGDLIRRPLGQPGAHGAAVRFGQVGAECVEVMPPIRALPAAVEMDQRLNASATVY